MTKRFLEEPFDRNPVLQFAAVNHLLAEEHNKRTRVLAVWSAKLEMLGQWSESAAVVIFLLAASHFIFWYGLHLAGDEDTVAAMTPYETSYYLNRGDPEGRLPVLSRLREAPGKQLVFVRFGPVHPLREWIQNDADIDQSRVVFALDLGRSENDTLRKYYPDRTAWLLEPDDRPPRLQPYPEKPGLHFELP